MSDNPMFGDGQSADWWNRIKESYPNHHPTYEPSDVQWEVARQMNCDWVRLRNQGITITKLQSALSASRAECERYRSELQNIADAKTSQWEPDVRDQFKEWAQNRARTALEAK